MTTTPARIAVGYDGSPDADLALTWAAETARRRGAALDVIIVAATLDPLLGADDYHESVEREAAEWRYRAAKVLSHGDDTQSDITIRKGAVVPTLLSATQDAEMLVVGSHGHGMLAGSLTGSVSQHLARHAGCPVVVVRPPHLPDSHRIVVGLDGSAESARALEFACELAVGQDQHVVAVHGYKAMARETGSTDQVWSSETAHKIENAERLVRDWVADAVKRHPDVAISTEAIAVSPVRALVDYSSLASLLVVGSRGRDAFADLLLGSVSQRLLHDAHCPVAVVR